ncbi:MAG TPA: NADH-quinone oxidoreductase subunit D [Ignavibacteriales bacterium]|nr:NADH-quinone oxidoreductase subunit 4 [bacterium BMS3Abin04]HDZ58634.1 NADH-quinone oxidoreductase subunit D [Ignavibacteriales bacterium]
MREKETTIYLGPQHPGITGNMMVKLKVAGDTIVKAETHVGYLHRAFEKLMEQRTWTQSFPIVCRICVPEPDPNEENLARAIEEIEGREVPERAKYIRVMVLELARLATYGLWMGGQSGSMGLYTMPQWTIGDRDYILDLFEELTGGRVYHMYIWAGGVRRDLPEGFTDRVLKTLDYLENRLPDYDNLLFNNALFQKRAQGVGIIPKDKAIEWGVVGPPLRGSGIKHDVRIDEPYEVYDKLNFIVPTSDGCDVWSRALVRRQEYEQSISIIRQVIEKMPKGDYYNKIPNPLTWQVPPGEAYVKTESARGEFGYYVVSDGSIKPRRVHVRGPAYVHGVSLLEKILVGANIADVSFIMNSLGTCPPEIER